MISAEYLSLQKQLHATGKYGVSGHKYAGLVHNIMRDYNTSDVLDYGCGQRSLERALGVVIRNYDPSIEGLDKRPEPADIVACTDVLEHIEPAHLDAVLDDLQRLVKKAGLFVVFTQPAVKVLADGRNAHLIQEKMDWWMPKLKQRFYVVWHQEHEQQFAVIVGALKSNMEMT